MVEKWTLNFLVELREKNIEKYIKPIREGKRKSKTPIPSRVNERHLLILSTTKEKPTKR